MSATTLRVACGSAYADDLIELAVDMVERGEVQYLCMDALAERTLALAQLRRMNDPGSGHDERLERVAAELLPLALERNVTLISNLGAADPVAAGAFLAKSANEAGLDSARVAVITGDDVLEQVHAADPVVLETGRPLSEMTGELISANAYLGIGSVVSALDAGANVIIGGRLSDPSLFVAPMVHHFGWALDEWETLGAATLVAHLLECGTHVTGGNFADPPYRVVPSFRRPSMPYADVAPDGTATLGKLAGTDGLLSVETCKVQLGYEIHDPANYVTPDVVADFTDATLTECPDGVAVAGARGSPRPDQLKVLVGVREGFVGEGQVSFAGPGALARAELARQIVAERIEDFRKRYEIDEVRYDLLGVNSIHGEMSPPADEPYEVHLRVAVRAPTREAAARIAHSVEYLQVFGPAGTGGHRRTVRPQLTMFTCSIPRADVHESLELL